jgi:hypothetical protein
LADCRVPAVVSWLPQILLAYPGQQSDEYHAPGFRAGRKKEKHANIFD